MLKHKRFIGKGLLFIVLLCFFVGLTNKILLPKYYYDNTWPTTSTFTDFYEMEKNTVDILFFGSSHGVTSFSPQCLYNDYSFRSYNLSSEQQNLLVSYYWLKEALEYQKPKVVILDTFMLYSYADDEALNSTEATTRKAFDVMRWSKNKIDAINDVAALDEKQSKTSYYLTNIRFHSRWKSLNEDDFTFLEMENHGGLKGFSALSGYCMNENYAPFTTGTSDERATMHPIMKEYLDRIVALCKEEEITLILTKTPAIAANIGKYNTLMDYAKENEIRYVDFNEETVYQECQFDYPRDSQDGGHLNIWGAEKVTDYIGKYLEENLTLEKVQDEQWESSAEYYAGIIKNCDLTKITDLEEYLQEINDERYTVFISVKDEGVSSLNDNIKSTFMELGLTTEFDNIADYGKSYYAVIDRGSVIEQKSETAISTSGTIRDGRVFYKISSAGLESGNDSSINIAGSEYSKKLRGFNIVVYDNDLKRVIDIVVFDTHDSGLEATR